ncbi:MAG: zinc-ribbon domain-containing protein [Bulleidia sp.]|nr:zinc-ribbon domain-containing protein [Bulleidia sp.]
MNCPWCHKAIPDSARKCPYCGKPTSNFLPGKMDDLKKNMKKGFKKIFSK